MPDMTPRGPFVLQTALLSAGYVVDEGRRGPREELPSLDIERTGRTRRNPQYTGIGPAGDKPPKRTSSPLPTKTRAKVCTRS